jgi:N-ethylmaleimide reductase
MGNNRYDRELAIERVESGETDLACIGRLFISNPDLVTRFVLNAPLAEWDEKTFYGGGEEGYTDYPSLSQEERARYAA